MNKDYLTTIIEGRIHNLITDNEAYHLINEYNNKHDTKDDINHDIMYYKISTFLASDNHFKLSLDYLKLINYTIFHDLRNDAGIIRTRNISKKEECLYYRSVIYSTFDMIENNINYDLENEKTRHYKGKSTDEKVSLLSSFLSNIWQAHPFNDGNTRTDMIFIQKYLTKLNIDYNTKVFDNNFIYFRNALVRSNYNTIGFIPPTFEYLEKFMYHLLTGDRTIMDINETFVPEDAMYIKHR